MVCAMDGTRRCRGFEPRFVRLSTGPLASPPPPPPSASPSTTGTADGWVACLVLVVVSFIFRIFCIWSSPGRHQSTHKNKAPGTTHLQQCPQSPVPPADGSRISSSYSPWGNRTSVFKAATGRTTAAVPGQKPILGAVTKRGFNWARRKLIWTNFEALPRTKYFLRF